MPRRALLLLAALVAVAHAAGCAGMPSATPAAEAPADASPAVSAATGDRDGDGLPDAEDTCPDDAEDLDGYQDDDGCAERDNDGDGVFDLDDMCPIDPEDYDDFEDGDGCPDPDNDQDGIRDVDDRCPDEPALRRERSGCPTPRFPPPNDRLEVIETLYFAPGAEQVDARQVPIIDGMVEVMRAHPLMVLRVVGHSDDRGLEADRRAMSQRRAEWVRAALIERGVKPERLEAEGRGSDEPRYLNDSAENRARNRRVGFEIIVEPDGHRRSRGSPAR